MSVEDWRIYEVTTPHSPSPTLVFESGDSFVLGDGDDI